MATPVQRVMLAAKAKQNLNTSLQSYPINGGTHGLLMLFHKYDFQIPGRQGLLRNPNAQTSPTKVPRGGVLLPLPQSLIDNFRMRLGRNDLGKGMDEAVVSIAAGKGGEYFSNLANDLQTMGWGEGTYSLARKIFDRSGPLEAVGQGIGKTLNPKTSLVFDGMNLKEYPFEWTLAPKEEAESIAIHEIVNSLKQNSLPAYGENANSTTRFMLEYPSTVDLFLLGVDPNYYMFFKTAMIESVSINYTPNGLSILRGGVPSAINLSIQLQEMDIHVSGDYGGEGAASDNNPLPRGR